MALQSRGRPGGSFGGWLHAVGKATGTTKAEFASDGSKENAAFTLDRSGRQQCGPAECVTSKAPIGIRTQENDLRLPVFAEQPENIHPPASCDSAPRPDSSATTTAGTRR